MTKIYVKFYDNEDNVVLLPVSDSDVVPPSGMKPAETYEQARKRNYRARAHNRLRGSVLLYGKG